MNRQSTYLTKLRGKKKKKLRWRWFVLSLIGYQAIAFISTPACLPACARESFYAVLVLLARTWRVLGGAVFGPLPSSLPHLHPSRSLVPHATSLVVFKQLEKDPAFINFGTHSNKRLVSSHNASLCPFKSHPYIHIRMINVQHNSSGTMVTMVKPKWWILPFSHLLLSFLTD